MNIRTLEYLTALHKYQHFGKAAEACFVSQPALSMQLKKLEDYLGVSLIERRHQNTLLTVEGVKIAQLALTALQTINSIKEYANSVTDPLQGKITLGIFPTLAPYLLPLIIPVLAKKFPQLAIYLLEEKTDNLLNDLKQGKIDIALLALPIIDSQLSVNEIFSEKFYLALPKSHPLASKKSIASSALKQERLLLLEEGHCLRDQALSFCHRLNTHEQQDFRATSLETLRHMVAANLGITLMPALACIKTPNVVYIPFSDQKISRDIALVWRNSTPRHMLFTKLADELQQIKGLT